MIWTNGLSGTEAVPRGPLTDMLDGVLLTATPSGSLIGSLPMWESACTLAVVLKARAATLSWGRRIITLEVNLALFAIYDNDAPTNVGATHTPSCVRILCTLLVTGFIQAASLVSRVMNPGKSQSRSTPLSLRDTNQAGRFQIFSSSDSAVTEVWRLICGIRRWPDNLCINVLSYSPSK